MKKIAFWSTATAITLTVGLIVYQLAFAGSNQPDCPGKIICPITGEEICKDQCPLNTSTAEKNDSPNCCTGK